MQSSGGSSPDLSLPQPLARIVPVMDQARGDARSLHAAAFVGDAQACRALLSLGADPALADAHGTTHVV